MVHDLDHPDVRFVATADLLAAAMDPGEEPTPDGGHYSPHAHRVVGQHLGGQILAWAESQPHLSGTGPRRTSPRRAGGVG
jgi:hypothetical protein